MWPNYIVLWRWDGLRLEREIEVENQDLETFYNWWINVNSVKKPDRLNSSALQIADFAHHFGCVVIAFLSTSEETKDESQKLKGLISMLPERLDYTFMYFWTDDQIEID